MLAGFLALAGIAGWKFNILRQHHAALNSIDESLRVIAGEPPSGFTAEQWRKAVGPVWTAAANSLLQYQADTAKVKALAEAIKNEPLRTQLHTPEGLFQMLGRMKSISTIRDDFLENYRFLMRDALGADDPKVRSKWEQP